MKTFKLFAAIFVLMQSMLMIAKENSMPCETVYTFPDLPELKRCINQVGYANRWLLPGHEDILTKAVAEKLANQEKNYIEVAEALVKVLPEVELEISNCPELTQVKSAVRSTIDHPISTGTLYYNMIAAAMDCGREQR